MDQEKTGALIRSLRMERGLTQREFAARLGVSDKAVSKWERGWAARMCRSSPRSHRNWAWAWTACWAAGCRSEAFREET